MTIKTRSISCQNISMKKSPDCILEKIGVKLTELSKDQADYIGVTPEGPLQAGTLQVLDFLPLPTTYWGYLIDKSDNPFFCDVFCFLAIREML